MSEFLKGNGRNQHRMIEARAEKVELCVPAFEIGQHARGETLAPEGSEIVGICNTVTRRAVQIAPYAFREPFARVRLVIRRTGNGGRNAFQWRLEEMAHRLAGILRCSPIDAADCDRQP